MTDKKANSTKLFDDVKKAIIAKNIETQTNKNKIETQMQNKAEIDRNWAETEQDLSMYSKDHKEKQKEKSDKIKLIEY